MLQESKKPSESFRTVSFFAWGCYFGACVFLNVSYQMLLQPSFYTIIPFNQSIIQLLDQ